MALLPDMGTEIVIPVCAVIGIVFALVQWVLVSRVKLTPGGGDSVKHGKNGYNDSLIEEDEGINDPAVVVKCAEIQNAISEGACCSTQLIYGNGTFNVDGIDKFIEEVKLAQCGLSYAVVAIMGPQSSGKSTLLNHLFGTNFREMDAYKGRSQTTNGIWLARIVDVEPCTIVMDIEGTDGRERGEDDRAFEKQSTLFALAVSDVVLINMWCHDIGRVHAANNPLLKIVFQVMMRLFSPRQTTLLFVIRDKTLTPLANLEQVLREDMQKIWDSLPKPQARRKTPLSDFFKVQVVALSNYEDKKEQFKEQVANLKQRFMHSVVPGVLAGDRCGVVPGSGFALSARKKWEDIKANKDLDLPAHKVMIAAVRCDEIANEKFSSFKENEEWCRLNKTVQSQPVDKFAKKLSSILNVYLSEYESETTDYDESGRSSKRKELEEKLLLLVQPAYQSMLGHIHSGSFKKFETNFKNTIDKGKKGFATAARKCAEEIMSQFNKKAEEAKIDQANWDSSKVKLRHDMDAHIADRREAKLSQLGNSYEKKLNEVLAGPVIRLLVDASDETWSSIRSLLQHETKTAVTEFSNALAGFEIDAGEKSKMLSKLKDYARGVVEAKAKEEAGRVLIRMKDSFFMEFNYDDDWKPRHWNSKQDIDAIVKTARSACVKILSVMAAIRLDDDDDFKIVDKTLSRALIDPPSDDNSTHVSDDLLASDSWEKIPSTKTLLTPKECKSLWQNFIRDTDLIVNPLRGAQDAIRRSGFKILAARFLEKLIMVIVGIFKPEWGQQHY